MNGLACPWKCTADKPPHDLSLKFSVVVCCVGGAKRAEVWVQGPGFAFSGVLPHCHLTVQVALQACTGMLQYREVQSKRVCVGSSHHYKIVLQNAC